MKAKATTVTDVRVHLFAAVSDEDDGCIIRNMDGTKVVYLGGNGVTSAQGYPLAAGEEKSLPGDVWAVCSNGETAQVRVLGTPDSAVL